MTRARDAAAAACIVGAGVGAILITATDMDPALATFAALTVAGLLGSAIAIATDGEAEGHPAPVLPDAGDDLMALADACRETGGSYLLAEFEADCADIADQFDRLRRNDRRAGMQ